MKLRIKEICEHQGMSMAMLAEIIGISKVSISLINSGKMNATLDTLVKIAKGLNVPIAELFEKPKYKEIAVIKCPNCKTELTIIEKPKN